MSTDLIKTKEVIYPESDGKPMAETDTHRNEMLNLLTALEEYYRNDPKVYVSGNIFLYYVEGNTNDKVAPDILIVKGIPKRERRTYKIWEEGKGPDVIIELTSDGTRFEDLYAKRELYRQLGVKEYYLYDPTGDYIAARLRAYYLKGKDYQEVAPKSDTWKSPVLGLQLRIEDGRLRLYHRKTGERLLNPAEQAQARRQAEEARRQAEEARRQAEKARGHAEEALARETLARQAAEKELERLQAELARLKKGS